MAKHVVRQGECLSSIAAKHGFGDWKNLYDHPKNAALKQKRPDPNLLFPGDEVFVPDRKAKTATVKTGQKLEVKVKVPKRQLRVRILDPWGKPVADAPFTLEAIDEFLVGKTDGGGWVKQELPAEVEEVLLFVGGRDYAIRVGALNPLDKADDQGVSGVQARLRNLGFDPGRVDGVLGSKTRRALCAFERKHSLEVTGEPKGATLSKLKEVHGC